MDDRGAEDGRLESVRKKVLVPASPDVAFQRFTAEIAEWWPLARLSVHGAAAEGVAFGEGVGAAITERGPGGDEVVWGTVFAWDPPRRVGFTWHPGRAPTAAQEVEVTFLSTGEATEATLVHRGWDALGERASSEREEYDRGWDRVLAAYRDSV